MSELDLTESRFGFDPRLVTLNEINGESGSESVAAAAQVFPPLRLNRLPIPNHPERTFELQAMWPYWHPPYGQHPWQTVRRHGPEQDHTTDL